MKIIDYNGKKFIKDALLDLKFNEFTDVQTEVLKSLSENNNLMVRSKTGSGKTHAFLIPIFEALDPTLNSIQALIVTPTKELALQIYKVAQHMASFSSDRIDIKLYSGGTDRDKEVEHLKTKQPMIAIGTPGKIKDLAVTENVLKIYKTKYLIVDEMDMAFETGFQDDLDSISSLCKDAKMMFFSATLSEKIYPFIKKYLDNPQYINLENKETLKIKHYWIPLKHRDRKEMLLSLLTLIQPYLCIIFANKKETVIELSSLLKSKNYSVGEIHGDLSPRERKRVLLNAMDLKYQYIVASDLAARGIDIDGVSHIINYELPTDYEFYMHRTGRTGRMNYEGIAYSFYMELDDEYLDNLSKKGVKPEYLDIKDNELIPYKGRNLRENRKKPKTDYEKIASKFVPKSNTVKPGYKKKREKAIKEIADKLKEKDFKKRRKY